MTLDREQGLQQFLAELLEVSVPFAPEDDFFDLGGDSLAAVELSRFASDLTGAQVPVRLIFEVSRLDSYIAAVLALDASADQGRA